MPMSQLAGQLTKWLVFLLISRVGPRPMSQGCRLTHYHANGEWDAHWHASSECLTPLA